MQAVPVCGVVVPWTLRVVQQAVAKLQGHMHLTIANEVQQ